MFQKLDGLWVMKKGVRLIARAIGLQD